MKLLNVVKNLRLPRLHRINDRYLEFESFRSFHFCGKFPSRNFNQFKSRWMYNGGATAFGKLDSYYIYYLVVEN